MMRRYHRWLSVLFGLLILWIAGTGAIVQFSRMTAPERPRPAAAAAPAMQPRASGEERDGDEDRRAAAPATSPAAAGGESARPAPDARRKFIHFVTELHSGEEFGIVGQLLGLLSGLALVFFAISGLWMYIQLFRGRLRKVGRGGRVHGGKWFWR